MNLGIKITSISKGITLHIILNIHMKHQLLYLKYLLLNFKSLKNFIIKIDKNQLCGNFSLRIWELPYTSNVLYLGVYVNPSFHYMGFL